jgi:hypothetical protein
VGIFADRGALPTFVITFLASFLAVAVTPIKLAQAITFGSTCGTPLSLSLPFPLPSPPFSLCTYSTSFHFVLLARCISNAGIFHVPDTGRNIPI